MKIDAGGVYYRDLNRSLREAVQAGAERIEIENVYGQRYIGTNLRQPVSLSIQGTPGNDLGAFMDGPRIEVFGNAQDGCGNTMNEGEIIVHGRAGDILAMSMRGGRIFIRDDVGYRVAIHMKEYQEKVPTVVIGGTAQDFFGEYMAGGRVILLGLNLDRGEKHQTCFIGTGMHGGVIYLRGEVEGHQLGKEVGVADPDEKDLGFLESAVRDYCAHFGGDPEEILDGRFMKLYPKSLRPYGTLYAY